MSKPMTNRKPKIDETQLFLLVVAGAEVFNARCCDPSMYADMIAAEVAALEARGDIMRAKEMREAAKRFVLEIGTVQ